MARIRSIKPDYWKSEAIARLPIRCRLTFIALWSYVDDNGVGRDNEKLIAAELYPLEEDPRQAAEWIREDLAILARESRVVRYTVEGRGFLAVTNWSEHQKIDRPNKPRYPEPDAEGATLLTCDDTEIRDTLATPSRASRADSSPGAVDQGAVDQVLPSSPNGDGDFDEFWKHYPRKVGKQSAAKEYRRARKTTEAADILAGVIRFAAERKDQDPQYTPHPDTWLRGGHWDDEPAATNVRTLTVQDYRRAKQMPPGTNPHLAHLYEQS